MIQTKKGIQLNQAFGAVLALVLVAVLVIVAIVLFVNLNSSIGTSASVSVINETTTVPGIISNSTLCQFGGMAVTQVFNATGVELDSGNYTSTVIGGITNSTTDAGSWSVSYTGTWGSEACTAGEDIITQFGTYPALVGLVGTIIFLGLVIGVLVAAFVFGGRREGV